MTYSTDLRRWECDTCGHIHGEDAAKCDSCDIGVRPADEFLQIPEGYLKIDSELRDYLSALRSEEYKTLEASILESGCESPLILWENTLIDGHNRYAICTEHDIDFEVEHKAFPDRDSVIDWMLVNQLGRRNLSPDDFRLFIGRLYNSRKKSQGGDRGNQHLAKPQNDGLPTSQVIADEHGTSKATVERAGKQAEAIDTKAVPELKEAVRNHKLPVSDAAFLATLPEDQQRQVVESDNPKQVAAEKKKVHVTQNTGNDEWYTPSSYIEAARAAMGSIDTDPASCVLANGTVQAKTFFDAESNGLEQEWQGNIWLNPPYSSALIGAFIETLCNKKTNQEFQQACVLVNNATETKWGQALLSASSAVCFVSRRIRYLDATGTPQKTGLQGQMICYLGNNLKGFSDSFSSFGVVLYGE